MTPLKPGIEWSPQPQRTPILIPVAALDLQITFKSLFSTLNTFKQPKSTLYDPSLFCTHNFHFLICHIYVFNFTNVKLEYLVEAGL